MSYGEQMRQDMSYVQKIPSIEVTNEPVWFYTNRFMDLILLCFHDGTCNPSTSFIWISTQISGLPVIWPYQETLKPGVGVVIRVVAWDPRVLSSSPVGPLN